MERKGIVFMDSNEITIHNVTASDIDEVAVLFDAYRVFYGKTSDIITAKNFLSDRIASEESNIILAKINDKCVGFVQLYPFFSSVNASRLLVLNDLFVDPNHRRMGVAKELMESATILARETKCKGLILETTNDNTNAQSLYTKLGWTEELGVKHYFLNI